VIHWQLTSQQYEAAFLAMDRDRLPYPTWNALRATDDDELGRQRRDAIETLLPRVDDELGRLLHTLTDPQVRVHVHGHRGNDPDHPETELRGYAGFGSSVAAVAIQDPDPQPGVSGEVTVSLCSPRQAVLLLARMIGEQRPGRHQLSVLKSELDVDSDWIGGWNRPATGRERVDKFFDRPRTEWGEVLCYPGRFLDDRADGVQGFGWMDFPRDGRYYVREDESSYTATPMSHDQFVQHVESTAWRVRELDSRSTAHSAR
jgi:hypothetical protein